MSKTNYTPGPWIFEPEETTDGGHYTPPQVFSMADPDNPRIVCTLAVRNGMEANGKFIARVPEMAEMLIYALPFIPATPARKEIVALLTKAGVL
jgi:hypothetical protein